MESTKEQATAPLARSIPRPARKPRPGNAFLSTLGIAVLLATLFTAWTPTSLFPSNLQEQLRLILTPQPGVNAVVTTPQPQLRIGIVAGHNGNDSGTVCTDENGQVTLTEAQINLEIATRVRDSLVAQGFQVDLLNEFDTRLNGYRAVALVSIHNDSCQYVNDQATGFKVAASLETRDVNRAQRLTACLTDRYQRITGLHFHEGSITKDMREYHAYHRDRLPIFGSRYFDKAHRPGCRRRHSGHPVFHQQRKCITHRHSHFCSLADPFEMIRIESRHASKVYNWCEIDSAMSTRKTGNGMGHAKI